MAAPGVPPILADLKDPKVAQALAEGHDADIPSSLGSVVGSKSAATSLDHDLERGDADAEKPSIPEKTIEEETDPNIIFWDGPDDPENPMNWTEKKKWSSIAVLSMCTLVTPLASSMFAPGVPLVMAEFRSNNSLLATFVVSVYILGFAFGPLIVAPLSEMYGRRICYNISNALFTVFAIACAVAPSFGSLVAFRFLMGCSGSAPLTIGGGTIADMMPPERRGSAMAIWSMGPLLGPVIGPVAGGYLVQAQGWRWVFWLLTILAGLCTIISFIFVRESYAPTLLHWKTTRLQKETGNASLRSKLDGGLSHGELFKRAIFRPTKMLFFSPIVFLLSFYMAVAYGILYVLFTTFTFVFEEYYRFSSGSIGLTYLPTGIGMITGMAIIGILSDRIIRRVMASGQALQPEHRLPTLLTIPGGICIPLGLFLYGWTVQYHVHWIAPLLGTAIVGIGLIACMMCINTYMVDAFTLHAASAMAANTVMRSTAGALIPLGALQMYDRLGLGWGNSLLAFIALALVPVPWLFRRYGRLLREKFPVEF